MKTGCNLKQWMSERSIGQSALANEIGVNRRTISKYFNNGFEFADIRTAIKICKYFGRTLDDFFYVVEG